MHYTNIFMTMHYDLKCRHEVSFKAKIGLTCLIVNSKAKNLNSEILTTESTNFRLPCQVQRLEVSVVRPHCRPRFALYTVHADHLNHN